jgi:formylglycine-generating enzyme
MVLIPEGTFVMGDNIDGSSSAIPTHSVTVSSFYLDQYEVTKALWDNVYTWATAHGYEFDTLLAVGSAENHPVRSVSWYSVVKWLNARSEYAGKQPVYYTNDSQTEIYRVGIVDVTAGAVNWTANGYRLPTEAEWEYAARAGKTSRFYTGDCITTDQANFDGHYAGSSGCIPGDNRRGTTPAGTFAPSPWGLYDIVGNVSEWTWDWYGPYSSLSAINPKGPDSGTYRVSRDGSWYGYGSGYPTTSRQRLPRTPSSPSPEVGFRSARSLP